MRKTAFSTAAAEVGRRDPVMANLIKRTSPFHLPRPSRGHFAALAESILHQQLAGAAARAIHGRFVALFDGDLSPEAVKSTVDCTRRNPRSICRVVRRRSLS